MAPRNIVLWYEAYLVFTVILFIFTLLLTKSYLVYMSCFIAPNQLPTGNDSNIYRTSTFFSVTCR